MNLPTNRYPTPEPELEDIPPKKKPNDSSKHSLHHSGKIGGGYGSNHRMPNIYKHSNYKHYKKLGHLQGSKGKPQLPFQKPYASHRGKPGMVVGSKKLRY